MADPIIRLKRSAVAGKRPTLANLPLGEVALNTYDGRLFVRQDTGGVGIATTIRTVNPWSENYQSGGEHSIYYDSGDVGIGTQIPTSTLDVNGTVTATSFVGNGSSITGITFDQLSDVTFTNVGQHDIAVYHDGEGWLNDPGASRVVQEVRNVTGIAITQAYPVYETGYNQGNERVTIDVANAGIPTAMPALGIIHDADLGSNSNGYVIISGIADGIDTSGYSEGDELYVAVGGGLTNTRPAGATDLIQKIGTVLRSHATTGSILIQGAGRTNDVPNTISVSSSITAGDGFYGDGSGITGLTHSQVSGAMGDVVDDTTPQLGGNLDLNSNDITGTGNINITGSGTFSGNVSIAGTLTYEDVTNVDSVGLITARTGIDVLSGDITLKNGSEENSIRTNSSGQFQILRDSSIVALTIDDNSGRVGIATDNPGLFALDVRGTGQVARFGDPNLSNDALWIDITNDGYPALRNPSSNDNLTLRSSGSVEISIDDNNFNTSKTFTVVSNGHSGSGTELFKINESGETTITASSTSALFIKDNSVDSSGLKLYSDSAGLSHINAGYGNLVLETSGTERFRIDSGGNVNITGVCTATSLLIDNFEIERKSGDTQINNYAGDLLITGVGGTTSIKLQPDFANDSITANSGGSVELFFNNNKKLETTTSGVDITGSLDISGQAIVNNSVYISDSITHIGDVDTSIRFPSNDTFTIETAGSERVRIDSNGNLGIGTDAPGYKLEVNGDIKVGELGTLWFSDTSGSIEKIESTASSLDLYADSTISFYESDASAVKFTINTNAATAYFSADSDTYWYRPAANTHAWTTNGVERFRINTTGVDVTGNITVTGTVDGRDVAADGTKLDGIESGATADQTAAEILTLIKTVDGTGSGLDADTVDGIQGASFLRSDANDTWSGNIETTSTNGIRFGSANQTDSNDGYIAAGKFSTGLNIVGTQTQSGTGRQIRIYGSVIDANGSTYWFAGNDGSGSGLDADLLDGIDSTGFLQTFYETAINSPDASGGTWTTATSSNWGDPKFNNSFDQNRLADGSSAYVQYNIPSGYKSCWISQLQWSSGGYADCYGVQSDGGLVFLRRINTRQQVQNSNEGDPDQHDGSTITHIGSGLEHFTAIRIQNQSGRIHLTGIAWTKNENVGYEGTGMVHPAQISHQGAGSGLDADTASIATTITISSNNDSTDYRVPYTSSNSGNVSLYVDNSDGMTYNPGTNTLSAGSFSGSGASLTGVVNTTGNQSIGGTKTFTGIPVFNGGTSGSSAPFTVDSTQVVTNLNADLLDGINSASFLRSDVHDASAPQRIEFKGCETNNYDTIATATGSQGGIEIFNTGIGNDAFMAFHAGNDFACYFGLDADSNSLAVGGWSFGANKYKIWHAGNDGAGSGLDADTVDGIQGASFLRSDANDSATGLYSFAAGAYSANVTYGGRSIQTQIDINSTSMRGGVLVRNANDFRSETDTASFMHYDAYNTSATSYAFRASKGTTLADTFWVKGDGTAYFADDVGIGNNNPGAKLDVFGTARIGGTVSSSRRADFDTNGRLTLAYGDNSNTSNLILANLATDATTNHGSNIAWDFGTNTSASPITAARIDVVKEQQWTSTATTQDAKFAIVLAENGVLGEKFSINSNGNVNLTGDLDLDDNKKILLGTGNDCEIYHNGSANIIQSTNGSISLQVPAGSEIQLAQGGSFEHGVKFIAGGAVQLYHNNSLKLATSSTGVDVTGLLSATTKSFVIDHPTKEGMKLRHGSLEGPENGVYIRGRLKDNNTIELPDYWTGLVDEETITVNLTPIGRKAPLHSVVDIADNTVVVESANDIVDCFYTVFGERKDVERFEVEF